VRGLAERAAELAAEMGTGETGGASEILHPKRLEVARVGQILGTQ
jgi:hypothetical protein